MTNSEHEARVLLLRVLPPVPAFVRVPGTHAALPNDLQTQQWDSATVYLAGKRGEFREHGLQASPCP